MIQPFLLSNPDLASESLNQTDMLGSNAAEQPKNID